MKRKIFLDFDGTLIQSKLIKKALFDLIKELGYEETETAKMYAVARDRGPLHPNDFISDLAKQKSLDPKPTQEKFAKKISVLAKTGFYDDAARFLENVDCAKYEINLITYGDKEWQRLKVKNTGRHHHFDHLYYVGGKDKWKYIDQHLVKNEKFIFVDDFARGVLEMKDAHPDCLAICIERADNLVDNSIIDDRGDIFRVKDFDEIQKIIENNYA